MLVVDAVAHAERSCGNEISRGHAQFHTRHGSIREAHREQSLDLYSNATDCLLYSRKCGIVRYTQTLVVLDRRVRVCEPGLDLWACTVHEDQFDAKAVKQRDVVHEIWK